MAGRTVAKACKTCPLLSQQLAQVTEMCRTLEYDIAVRDEEFILASIEHQAAVTRLADENKRLRLEYRAFLDTINWWKEELDGDSMAGW